jgi:hypothetical protein
MKQKILFPNYLSEIKSILINIKKTSIYLFCLNSQRLLARQCLAHPWLTRRPKLVSKPSDEEMAGKQLSTKKLRRFVIRRRWQVNLFK